MHLSSPLFCQHHSTSIRNFRHVRESSVLIAGGEIDQCAMVLDNWAKVSSYSTSVCIHPVCKRSRNRITWLKKKHSLSPWLAGEFCYMKSAKHTFWAQNLFHNSWGAPHSRGISTVGKGDQFSAYEICRPVHLPPYLHKYWLFNTSSDRHISVSAAKIL